MLVPLLGPLTRGPVNDLWRNLVTTHPKDGHGRNGTRQTDRRSRSDLCAMVRIIESLLRAKADRAAD
ncbi:hypothetical protein [Celeribacter litoreus]|uniref:hypothetical protein n=1 Tax=Celeribacter litoreus TaxID=2876714 RepID=UPI001CCDA159|nr:hypothetical protein [Celeribacter litoreus]